jgi:hypothetical protein
MRKANSKAYAGEAAQKDGVSRRILMAWLPRLRSGQVQPRPTKILEFERGPCVTARLRRYAWVGNLQRGVRAGRRYALITAPIRGTMCAAKCAPRAEGDGWQCGGLPACCGAISIF